MITKHRSSVTYRISCYRPAEGKENAVNVDHVFYDVKPTAFIQNLLVRNTINKGFFVSAVNIAVAGG